MNWYSIVKISAIWDVQYDNTSIISLMEALYELTYKYQRLQTQSFRGYPKRYDNILSRIEQQSRIIIQDISSILSYVFEDWLKKHALLNPRQWAENRVEEHFEINGSSPDEIESALESEVSWIKEQQQQVMTVSYNDIESSISLLDAPVENGSAPFLSAFFESQKEYMYEESLSDNLSYNEEDEFPKTEEYITKQTRDYYDNLIFSEYMESIHGNSISSLLKEMQEYYDIYEIAVELFEFLCFPVWYGFWQQMGIDETRSRVEQAYHLIGNIENQPIKQAFASINIIINIAHQTGSMAYYISAYTGESEQDIVNVMDHLSNNIPSEWDSDLQEVGSVFDQQENQQQITEKNNIIDNR